MPTPQFGSTAGGIFQSLDVALLLVSQLNTPGRCNCSGQLCAQVWQAARGECFQGQAAAG